MNDINFLSKYFPAPNFLDMPYVGIDISPVCIRMMEIIDHPTRRVGRYAEIPLTTPFLITDGDHQEVKEILKKWKKEYKLEYIKATLPEEKAYLFDTEIEYTSEEKMRSSIEFSLEENVPLSGSDVLFDYRIISESEKKGFIKIAVTVLPTEVVSAYLELFHECDLQPISFLIEAQALSRALIQRGDQGTYLIVNINKTRTGVFIVSGGAVQFTSTVPIGSNDFTKTLEKELSISTTEAETLKEAQGFSRTGDNKILPPLMNTAALFRQEIEKVYVYWNKHHTSVDATVSIQKIILSGKEALTPGFKEYFNQTLRLPIEVGNVWSNLASFDEYVPPLLLTTALNFGAAIGLALPENE
jgi:type IV pilus assembly protein PilM